MPTCALAIVTRGMICCGDVTVTSSDQPRLSAVVEVRPTIKATIPPETQGPAGTPAITAAQKVVPRIVKTTGPQQGTGSDAPGISGAENLVPFIKKAEEDD